ncbi:hypothetical protein SAMN06265346_12059 [Flavobacterium hercynium]|nr:hypothetical protein SAMN06265346_12059 [Flavobacterium hercynium]
MMSFCLMTKSIANLNYNKMKTDENKNQYDNIQNNPETVDHIQNENYNEEQLQQRGEDDNLEEDFDQNYSESEDFATD